MYQNNTQQGRGEWWFRLTAPQLPQNRPPTFKEREAVRRGRIASLTIVLITANTLVPLGSTGGNIGFLTILVSAFLANALALFVFNRRGNLATAGWIVIIILELGFVLGFLVQPDGISTLILPAFDLLAEVVLVVVAFFHPRSVFWVMAFNVIFIVSWITFCKHTPEIAGYLNNIPYTIFYPSVSLLVFSAFITYIWANSATIAIQNLDRSEEIINLERKELDQQQKQIALKEQLEAGMQQLLETHSQAANGNLMARVPLSQDNILWRVAYSLNNLLQRMEKLHSVQAENDRMKQALHEVSFNIQHNQPVQRTNTPVDEIVVSLYAAQQQAHLKQSELTSDPSNQSGSKYHAPPSQQRPNKI